MHEEYLKFQLKTLETTLKEEVGYTGHDYFKDLYFVPNNLTSVSLDDVDLSTEFLGKKLKYSIGVASFVGGTEKLTQINQAIGEFCNQHQIAQSIGDEIHGLQKDATPEIITSYTIAREKNPKGLILGNLSARWLTQANPAEMVEVAQKAIDLIQADALEIYIEPLVDILWKKNQKPSSVGLVECLEKIIKEVKTPIIVKSLSTGLTNEDVKQLWDVGVAGVNIQGVGGTSMARIETLKRLTLSDKQMEPAIKRPFDFFGTPTVWSLLDITLRPENQEIPLIVGGGIRDGRQAVKALALGADIVSVGYPILIEIMEDFGYPDEQNLHTWFSRFIHQMKMTMVLLGAKTIPELRALVRSRVVLLGKTKEWVTGRHLTFPPKKIRS
jgi:isopentenyl-diphosphate delta-isomerase